MIYLYNTLTKEKEEFKPLQKGSVSMYNCGPTVYGRQHLGNLRAAVLWDFLRRTLEYNGYSVKQIVNITDFGHLVSDNDDGEDKMMKGLRNEGLSVSLESMQTLAQKYAGLYFEDRKALNIQEASSFPFATHFIQQDIEFIQGLEEKNIAYTTSDGVYFDTSKNEDYGKLRGGKKIEIDPEHARITENSEKKQPEDFALWKFNSEIGWDSPWGKGFPGWHIECSVMSRELLGDTFDIHTGGKEHIAIHHTNEIAQSESLTGKPMATYWLHNNWLTMKNSKVAKSSGNVAYLDTLEEKGFSPLALRYLFLQAQYRSEQDFTWEALEASQKALERLKGKIAELPDGGIVNPDFKKEFTDRINDDLNTPHALGLVSTVLKDTHISESDKKATILDFDRIFGLNLDTKESIEIPDHIQTLLDDRQNARDEKDWAKADQLRDSLESEGFIVKDTNKGQDIRQKHTDI